MAAAGGLGQQQSRHSAEVETDGDALPETLRDIGQPSSVALDESIERARPGPSRPARGEGGSVCRGLASPEVRRVDHPDAADDDRAEGAGAGTQGEGPRAEVGIAGIGKLRPEGLRERERPGIFSPARARGESARSNDAASSFERSSPAASASVVEGVASTPMSALAEGTWTRRLVMLGSCKCCCWGRRIGCISCACTIGSCAPAGMMTPCTCGGRLYDCDEEATLTSMQFLWYLGAPRGLGDSLRFRRPNWTLGMGPCGPPNAFGGRCCCIVVGFPPI